MARKAKTYKAGGYPIVHQFGQIKRIYHSGEIRPNPDNPKNPLHLVKFQSTKFTGLQQVWLECWIPEDLWLAIPMLVTNQEDTIGGFKNIIGPEPIPPELLPPDVKLPPMKQIGDARPKARSRGKRVPAKKSA